MSRRGYSSDTLWRLYQIGGADLALRYAEMSSESSSREPVGSELKISGLRLLHLRAPRGLSFPCESTIPGSPRATTRYVYAELELANPWRYVSMEYKIVARFIKPDGSLMGESEGRVETNPEWETYYHSQGWGWEEPGNWSPGDYRVEIEIDHEPRKTAEFTIYDDLPERPRPSFSAPFSRRRIPLFSGQNLTWIPLPWSKPKSGFPFPNLDQVPPNPKRRSPVWIRCLEPVGGEPTSNQPGRKNPRVRRTAEPGLRRAGWTGSTSSLLPEIRRTVRSRPADGRI
jgi:hypothetical protein